MRHTLLTAAAALALTACTGASTAETAPPSEPIDSVYTEQTAAALIDKAHADASRLTQTDYASMIEQCRGINERIVQRLLQLHFNDSMTGAQIDSAMQVLRTDTVMPILEAQSRELLVILQNADLDEPNRDRYASMVAAAESALRRLR